MPPSREGGESSPYPTPVWLDCDPGHDDALAIILAGHNPHIDLFGVSTVHGNSPVAKTTENALNIMHVSGLLHRHVPVVEGQAAPLVRKSRICPEIHGESGLDGFGFPPLPDTVQGRAVPKKLATDVGIAQIWGHIVEKHTQLKKKSLGRDKKSDSGGGGGGDLSDGDLKGKAEDGEGGDIASMKASLDDNGRITIVATGCLTNIALLLTLYPRARDIVRIVFMGGAIGPGNTGPCAEFNIQVDPEAAKIVMDSGLATMVPLEVTHTCLVTPEIRESILADDIGGGSGAPSPFARGIVALLDFFASTYRDVFDFDHPPLHDPCAIAYVIAPGLFTTRRLHVDVETGSPLTAGQTVVDMHNLSQRPEAEKNVDVALSMNVDGFWKLMLAALRHANRASCLNKAA